MKQGQVTIFILFGLLILLFVGFFVIMQEITTTIPSVTESQEAQAVRTSFSYCLETELQKAITTIAMRGGYFEEPPMEIETYFTSNTSSGIPYYFDNGENVAPSQETVEQQLALALEARLSACTNFTEYPYNVSVGEGKKIVRATMSSETVEAIVTFPLKIAKGNIISSVDTFPLHVRSSLLKLYTTALEMTEEQQAHPDSICLTCLTKLTTDANAYLGMMELRNEDKHTVLYVLNDRDTSMENQISFYFGHGFIRNRLTQNVTIASIEPQTALIGYPYTYHVIAAGKNIAFSDNSPVFAIDPKTGIISFTPTRGDIGSRIVTITATDKDNNKAQTSFVFEVKDVVASELSLEPLPYFVAHAGKEFNYVVEVTANQKVYFLDDTNLFDVNPNTGVINFTPTTADVGSHNFTITTVDTLGNSDVQQGYMVVTK